MAEVRRLWGWGRLRAHVDDRTQAPAPAAPRPNIGVAWLDERGPRCIVRLGVLEQRFRFVRNERKVAAQDPDFLLVADGEPQPFN